MLPCCGSVHYVIIKEAMACGSSGILPVFEKPSIRMFCNHCEAGFVWMYEFVGPKQRYSSLFRSYTLEHSLGSTAAHSARIQNAQASTVQRMYNEAVPALCDRIKYGWKRKNLAIKKGHTFNTAFTTSKAKRCWICFRVGNWRNCVSVPRPIPTS